MTSRTCSDCGESNPDRFYISVKKRCKECHKARVRGWYDATRPERSAYDASRFKTPKRKAHVLERQAARRAREPQKYAARQAVGRAVRSGSLVRKPCEVCGATKSQAHHEDYSKPLEVRWLCFIHHREAHGQIVTRVTF